MGRTTLPRRDGSSYGPSISATSLPAPPTLELVSVLESTSKSLMCPRIPALMLSSTRCVSSSDRLGKSEVNLVQDLIDGVELLIEMEKRLERRRSIEDLMPRGLRK